MSPCEKVEKDRGWHFCKIPSDWPSFVTQRGSEIKTTFCSHAFSRWAQDFLWTPLIVDFNSDRCFIFFIPNPENSKQNIKWVIVVIIARNTETSSLTRDTVQNLSSLWCYTGFSLLTVQKCCVCVLLESFLQKSNRLFQAVKFTRVTDS